MLGPGKSRRSTQNYYTHMNSRRNLGSLRPTDSVLCQEIGKEGEIPDREGEGHDLPTYCSGFQLLCSRGMPSQSRGHQDGNMAIWHS